jgi:RHS repeat-associated protein
MPTSTYTYNLDGSMTTSAEGTSAEGAAAGGIAMTGEQFSSIRRHDYTRLPTEITGSGVVTLRYDSSGRRLHKTGVQTIFYRNGTHHPTSYRTTETQQGDEIHHPLVEHVCTDEIIYLFTPAGQTVTRRAEGYTRVERDHLCSVRAETYLPFATCHLPFNAASITAHYSAYGKAIISGGELRRAFAGYESDDEVGLYNANRRLYAPTLRLFVSLDPRLQNASPYPYCGSDPFNNVDPTGGIASGIVSAIVQALVVIMTVVITCATDGVGAVLFPVETGAEAGAEGAAAASTAATVASTVGSTMLKGFIYTALTTAASNGSELIVKAAYGEHISAWQAVKSMIIEPLIAGAAGAASGAVLSGGAILFGNAILGSGRILSALTKMLVVGVSAMTYSAVSSVGTAAVNNQLSGSGEHIGIQMAIAFGEAALLEGAYLFKGAAFVNRGGGAPLSAAEGGTPIAPSGERVYQKILGAEDPADGIYYTSHGGGPFRMNPDIPVTLAHGVTDTSATPVFTHANKMDLSLQRIHGRAGLSPVVDAPFRAGRKPVVNYYAMHPITNSSSNTLDTYSEDD